MQSNGEGLNAGIVFEENTETGTAKLFYFEPNDGIIKHRHQSRAPTTRNTTAEELQKS
jgi:hypothetical protein